MISKHISMKEATKSITALRLGIDNTPNADAINNMKLLAEKSFEPLREWVGGAIKINSMYRSPALNEAIGGSQNLSIVAKAVHRRLILMTFMDTKQTLRCLIL